MGNPVTDHMEQRGFIIDHFDGTVFPIGGVKVNHSVAWNHMEVKLTKPPVPEQGVVYHLI